MATESTLLPQPAQNAIFDEVMDHIISAFIIYRDEKNVELAEKGKSLIKEFQYCCEPDVKDAIQYLTQQLLERNCIHRLFGNIKGIHDILSYRNLYIALILYYHAVGEIAGNNKFQLGGILNHIIVGKQAEASKFYIEKFINLCLSELDKMNKAGYDSECHALLLHIRSVLMKTRELTEEEMREWETSGEADADFVAKKRISQDSQLALAQGWTDRGHRKAHGGKKSRKKRKIKRKSKKI
jgi:hypothetical protein